VRNQYRAASKFLHMLPILHNCLASLLYHEQTLRSLLPGNHPIFFSYLFSVYPETQRRRFASFVSIEPDETMSETGIPPHVVQLRHLEKLLKMPASLLENIKKMLQENSLQSDAHVTVGSLKDVLEDFKASLILSLPKAPSELLSPPKDHEDSHVIWTFAHGAFRRLPKDFRFPRGAQSRLDIAWRLWFFGNVEKKWSRFRDIQSSDLIMRSEKQALSEWRLLMNYLITSLEKNGFVVGSNPTPDCVNEAFMMLFQLKILSNLEKKSRKTVRASQRTVSSALKEIRKARHATSQATPCLLK
jgi:hypothetical protein